MPRVKLVLALVTALAASSCSSPPREPATAPLAAYDDASIDAPHGSAGPGSASLPAGVDASTLDDRERRIAGRMLRELFAPCAEQAVSIAQCLEEHRPCGGCASAASFVVRRLARGDAGHTVQGAYAARFAAPQTIERRDSPSLGPKDAKVTIVEWFDFQCPACRYAFPRLDDLVQKSGSSVTLVHKFYPLRAHPRGEAAARAGFAAMKQGKYWEMARVLFDHPQELEPADLDGYARDLGLDVARFKQDAAGPEATAVLARDRADAEALGLDGTPFLWINGRSFDARYFRLDEDLAPWVDLDAQPAAGPAFATTPASAAPPQ